MEDLSVVELKQRIIREQHLSPGDKMNFERLQNIANNYGLDPRVLAVNIFGVTYSAYRAAKSPNNIAKNIVILRDELNDFIEECKQKINGILKSEHLVAGEGITYRQLCSISERNQIPERILALDIFGISYAAYNNIKAKESSKAIILKEQLKQEIKKLKEYIMHEEDIQPGDKLDYNRLERLAKKYNIDTKTLALKVFEAGLPSYNNIKDENGKTKYIVAYYREYKNKKQQAIGMRNTILQEESISPNSKIDYQTIQAISKKYSIPERILTIFVLRIYDSNYYRMKKGEQQFATISIPIDEDIENSINGDNIEDIRQQVLLQEGLFIGGDITYKKLLEISSKYHMDASYLAIDILGIGQMAYNHRIRQEGNVAIILNDFLLDPDKLEEIKQNILKTESISPGDRITYAHIQQLVMRYRIDERELAIKILGLEPYQYSNLKIGASKTSCILNKEKQSIDEEQITKIKEYLQQYGIVEGYRINCTELTLRANECGINSKQLATILGISEPVYRHIIRNEDYLAIVNDGDIKTKVEVLKNVLDMNQFYSKQEIEDICTKNGISVQNFIDYVINNTRYFGFKNYAESLEQNGGLWIGERHPLSEEFVSQNIDTIQTLVGKACSKVYYKYIGQTGLEKEDIISDTILYVLENCGDLEKNFNGDQLNKLIYLRARKNITARILHSFDVKVYSTTAFYKAHNARSEKGNSKNIDLDIPDTSENVEDRVINTMGNKDVFGSNEDIFIELQRCVENGCDRETALKSTAEKFGFSKEELLKAMQTILVERGKVRKTEKGDYILGE